MDKKSSKIKEDWKSLISTFSKLLAALPRIFVSKGTLGIRLLFDISEFAKVLSLMPFGISGVNSCTYSITPDIKH